VNGIGGKHHGLKLLKGMALQPTAEKKFVGLREAAENAGNIGGKLRIIEPEPALEGRGNFMIEEGF
jgi:hypothetical protein